MQVRAISIACLLSGVLAVPMPEEVHAGAQQVQPLQVAPAAQPAPVAAPMAGYEADYADWDWEDDEDEGGAYGPDMMMMAHRPMGHHSHGVLSGNVDVNAFQEMVHEVQAQVQAIEQLMTTTGGDPHAMMEALVAPMAHLDQTLARGVSRLALPNLGGILGGIAGATKKPAPLTLLGELLRTVSNLLENLLTRGPLGELLNGLLGGVLGGVGGTVGGLLGGGIGVGSPSAQVPVLVDSILGSLGALLPGGAAGLIGGPAP